MLDEYRDHYKRENSQISENISSSILSGSLHVLPDVKELENIIHSIGGAKKRVWIETYIWTEKSTRDAVIDAKDRGVDVRVILEPNVYNTPRINDDTVEMLSGAHISVTFSSERYTFTHMKLWIIDDMGCVSTGNWSYTTFTKNREFIFCSTDRAFLSNLEEIFLSDGRHERPIFQSGGLDSRIGLAPENMRKWLKKNLELAKQRIIVMNQSIADDEILDILSQKKNLGLEVLLCSARKISNTSGEVLDSDIHIPKNLKRQTSDGPYLHAKVILIDTGTVILGSANITPNAIDNNREIMVRIDNNPLFLEKIQYIYDKDCKSQG